MSDPQETRYFQLLHPLPPRHAAADVTAPLGGGIRQLVTAVLTVLLCACAAYQAPSGRGYDYDRGRAMARSDTGSDRLVYFTNGYAAETLVVLGQRIEANCGFTVRPVYRGAERERRELEFAQGYNSVSVPVIEQRLGAAIETLMQRCANRSR